MPICSLIQGEEVVSQMHQLYNKYTVCSLIQGEEVVCQIHQLYHKYTVCEEFETVIAQ